VQLIAHIPALAMMLLSSGLKDVGGNDVNQLVQKIIATLLRPRSERNEMAFYIKDVLRFFPAKYQRHSQECAYEFLMDLFGLIDDDSASKWIIRPLGIIECSLNLTHKCQCGVLRNSHTVQCTTVSLSIPRTEDGKVLETYSLQEMLNDFSTLCGEVTGSDATCPECAKRKCSIEQASFAMIGTVLVLNIGFFATDGRKLLVHVNIEETLSIVQKCPDTDENLSCQTVEYQLAGIIYHHGASRTNGHYTTRFRGPNGWHSANDERVYPVEGPEIKNLGPGKAKSTSVPCIVVYTKSGQIPEAIHSRLSSMASGFPCFSLADSRFIVLAHFSTYILISFTFFRMSHP